MSEVEKLEARYRSLATKLIYASFEAEPDPNDLAELARLGEELASLNAADFSRREERQLAAA